MNQIIIGFGFLIFSLLVLFRLANYAQFRLHFGMELWIAVFSVLILIIGIFISRKMLHKEIITEKQVLVEIPATPEISAVQLTKLGLSKRAY